MVIAERKPWTELRPLEGRMVRLRALEPEDEPRLYEWFNDQEVIATAGGSGYAKSHAQEREWIEKAKNPNFERAEFGVVALVDGELIGTIGLRMTSPENRGANLGLTVGDKSRWNQGYGTDAMRVICRFGFEQMNLHRIELSAYADNRAGIRVYEKVGFKIEGTLRSHAFYGGRYLDGIVMGLLEDELILD
ncbi:MAG: GNAT family protein [Dehalococcoidia bacterium]